MSLLANVAVFVLMAVGVGFAGSSVFASAADQQKRPLRGWPLGIARVGLILFWVNVVFLALALATGT